MQSGSLSPAGFAGAAWTRTRAAVPASTLWTAAIVFLLVLVISRSTAAASWVTYGIETAPLVALGGAALLGILAVTPLPWYVCVGLGLLLGPVVAGFDAAPAFRVFHPSDPTGLAFVQTWIGRIQDGTAFSETPFVLFVIAWLMWIAGAWLAWCVLRWRQPLIGLVPGAAAFATNVLNSAENQNGFTLGFLVLTFALLLWTNYTGSIARALSARVKLSGDAKWDFWESGLVATAALIVVGIMLPPISTIDRTATMESSAFSSWAQLQQALNHQVSGGTSGSNSAPGTTGFSTEVHLGSGLIKSNAPVFTYTVTGPWIGPRYFRGVNATEMVQGEWRYNPISEGTQQIARDIEPYLAETYGKETFATFTINMAAPPGVGPDLIFYPGQLVKIDRDTTATESINPDPVTADQALYTIDRLTTLRGASSKGTYNVTVETPNAFAADLEAAGTDYPQWLGPYLEPPPDVYRPGEVLDMERSLAEQITLGKPNVFDQAMAIRDFLYTAYEYSLRPGNPSGDGMQYFLQVSKKGYCVYFATAMGDMLRLLGIPTRLVSGFGPGTPDLQHNRYVVTGSDAHVWVEVYFPGYGWTPFDPTPAPNIPSLNQYGFTSSGLCISADRCGTPAPSTPVAVATPSSREIGRGAGNQGVGGGGPGGGPFRFGLPDAGTLTKVLGVLLAVMLLIAAYVSRYLRPRTVMGVWQRTLVLARFAGVGLTPGETPLEFGRRLARVVPEAEAAVRALAGGFAVAAYAPPETAETARAGVMDAWAQLRPSMLRHVASRLAPHRA